MAETTGPGEHDPRAGAPGSTPGGVGPAPKGPLVGDERVGFPQGQTEQTAARVQGMAPPPAQVGAPTGGTGAPTVFREPRQDSEDD